VGCSHANGSISKKALSARFVLFACLAIFNSLFVYIRVEPVVQVWSVMITLVSILLMAGMLFAENFLKLTIFNRVIEFLTGVTSSVTASGKIMYKALVNKSENSKNVRISAGIVIAVILALVFIGLFSGSDAVFRHQFSFLGNFLTHIGNILKRYNLGRVFSIIFWSFVSAAGLLTLIGKDVPAKELTMPGKKFFSKNDTSIILATLCAVFGLFIIIQIKYLFAGSVLPDNLTYADYARRGYGELLLANILASGVIYAAVAFTKDAVRTKLARILSNVLVILNGIVVFSAWKRLSLYESAYGWTMTRFVARLGLICIMLGSVLLLFWVNQRISSKRLFGYAWYGLTAVLMIAALLNPIGIITQKNISERSQREVSLDTVFLRQLSADSYPALCKYAPTLKSHYANEYAQLLDSKEQTTLFSPEMVKNELHSSNRGLSAHYTLTEKFKKNTYNCLK